MKNLLLLTFSLATLTLACKENSNKIKLDLIKSDWISEGDNFFDNYLFVQDSLMIESLTNGESPISPYKISNDTLIIYSRDFDYENFSLSIKRILKFKILFIDSSDLIITPAYPNSKDTILFKRVDQTKRNDLKIEELEFSYTGGYGFSQDIRIEKDSTLFHFGYSRFSKYNGLSKCKLDSEIFERIQRMIYTIHRDSFELRYPGAVTSNFFLFIKSKTDSIEIEGVPDSFTDSKLEYVINYLMALEYLVNLDTSLNENIHFKYKRNSKFYNKNNTTETI